MAFQNPYPKNTAVDFDTDWVAEWHNQQEDQLEALTVLVAAIKTQVTVFIDPDGEGDYLTIQEALDDGKSFLVLAPGKNHVGNVTPPVTRSYYIAPYGDRSLIGCDWAWWTEWATPDYRQSTKITGDIFLANAQNETRRRSFVLSNVDIVGDFRGQDGWNARFFKCGLSGEYWQENDVIGDNAGKGCQLTFDKCFSFENSATNDTVRWKQTGVYLNDGMGSNIYMRGCDFAWWSGSLDGLAKPVFELAANNSYLDVRDSRFFLWFPAPSPNSLRFMEVPYPLDNPNIWMFFKNVKVEFFADAIGGVSLLDGSGGEAIVGNNFHVHYENVYPPFRLEGGSFFTSYDHRGIDFFGGPIFPTGSSGSGIYPVFEDMDLAAGTGWINVPAEGNDLNRTAYPTGRWAIQEALGGIHLGMGNLFIMPVTVDFGGGGPTFPLGQVLGPDDFLVGAAFRPCDPVTYGPPATHIGLGVPADPDKHWLTPALFGTGEHAETLFERVLLGTTDDLWISSCDGIGGSAGQFNGGKMMVLILFRRRVGMLV